MELQGSSSGFEKLNESQTGAIVTEGMSEEQLVHLHSDKMEILNKEIINLEAAIEKEMPDYKGMMLQIDGILRSYPELAYKLTEEQIGIISRSMIKDADITFFSTNKTEGGSGKKAIPTAEAKKILSSGGSLADDM